MPTKPRSLLRLFLSLCALPCLLSAAEAEVAPKPNIILILVDDMGYSDLGCFGGEIDTPTLDTLASSGLRFTDFTNNAKCETTRTALMSGQHHTVVRQGNNNQRFYTIPESLALADYQNFMVGKWHIFGTPMQRGFDRYFGFHEGATNFFNGEGTGGGFSYHLNDVPLEPSDLPDDFYSTDAFTDYAIQFVEERDTEKPFFMYMAYNAPHYPLQAPQADVEKYLDLEYYKDGWSPIRTQRLAQMKTLGLLPADTPLSDPEDNVRDWANFTQDEKDDMELRMATYAAMVDRVDQQLARLITTLKTEEIFDNTLIIFLSDNGACPFDRTRSDTKTNNYMPWDERSYWCYPHDWANACNTPFRMYKQNQHEGGIAAPMIAHWPNGIDAELNGSFNRERGHVRDFHSTFCELAGVELPDERNGLTILDDSASISFVPVFSGQPRPEAAYYYQYYGLGKNALVIDNWKLVDRQHLYNIETDRIESNDLSSSNPTKFYEMMSEWTRLDTELNESRASDPLAPPSDLIATTVSDSQIDLSWSAVPAFPEIDHYLVLRDDLQIGSTATTNFSDTDLKEGRTYTFTVVSVNIEDEASSASAPASATTLATPDLGTVAPTTPANLTAVAIASDQVQLAWSASTDDVAVDHYVVRRDGAIVASNLQALSYTDSGLSETTSYAYTVTAVDRKPNESAATNAISATTFSTPPTIVLLADSFTDNTGNLKDRLVETPESNGDKWWSKNTATVRNDGKMELENAYSRISLPFTQQTETMTLSWEVTVDGDQVSWSDGKALFYAGFGYDVSSVTNDPQITRKLSYGFNVDNNDLWTGTELTVYAGKGPDTTAINDFSFNWTRSAGQLWQGYFAVSYNPTTLISEYFFSASSLSDALSNGSLGTVTGAELDPVVSGWDGLSVEKAWFKTDSFEASEGLLIDNVKVTIGQPSGGSSFEQFAASHNLSGDPTADKDSDGMSDYGEYVFGSDPENGSIGAPTVFDASAGAFQFKLIGDDSVVAQVQTSQTLTVDSWLTIATIYVSSSDGTLGDYSASIDTTTTEQQFFRVEVE